MVVPRGFHRRCVLRTREVTEISRLNGRIGCRRNRVATECVRCWSRPRDGSIRRDGKRRQYSLVDLGARRPLESSEVSMLSRQPEAVGDLIHSLIVRRDSIDIVPIQSEGSAQLFHGCTSVKARGAGDHQDLRENGQGRTGLVKNLANSRLHSQGIRRDCCVAFRWSSV